MSALRCPHCRSVFTDGEARSGQCPECAAPLAGTADSPPIPEAIPVSRPARSRIGFLAGLVVGVILAAAGATGAWWAWGPAPFPANVADRRAEAEQEARQQAADEQLRQAEAAAQSARDAARQADLEREATEQRLATVRDQVQTALGQLAAAEKERANGSKGSPDAPAKGADAAKTAAELTAVARALTEARARLQATQAQQAELDRQLAASQGRLAAGRAREDQVRQLEAATQRAWEGLQQAQTQRTAAERALADAKNRLQATLNEQAEAERQLAASRARAGAGPKPEAGERAAGPPERDRPAAARVPPPPGPDDPPAPAVPLAVRAKSAFARNWLVVGPFPNPDRKGHETAFPPEDDRVKPGKEFKGATGAVQWRAHHSPADYVDLADAFGTRDPAVGYAVCWVRASRGRRVVLSLGTSGGIKVWVNGKVVADHAGDREAAPGQNRVACDLANGWTEVRVKVDGGGGPLGFYLEARDPVGDRPLAGLEYRTTPPDAKPTK